MLGNVSAGAMGGEGRWVTQTGSVWPCGWVWNAGLAGYQCTARDWAFYPCTPPEIPPSEWIGALHERGIREISIVGDSHQRFLAAHLAFLLTAQADGKVIHWQDDLVLYARDDSSNRTLRINFYWIDGIYKNGEFGCTHRGQTTNRSEAFPEISPTADVTLFEGGYWAASFCRQPLKALRVHLEEFARWALAAAPAKCRVIFRTIPSFPVAGDRSESPELAVLPAGAATVLDTWQVDGPRYADTAVPHDHHYSVVKLTDQGAVVTGDVGEAQVRAFIHYLLHVLPPPTPR
ncbi:unnamed protein product [Closterium sp. Naga37s-1]|nr:unnamed protein product [Closterium sp. Naga37s-1]